MPWYKAGTVNVTLNSNAVTGVGTAFIANCRVGDAFRGPDGRWYEVTNAPSNTSLSISPAYLGPTASGGSYALAPMQGYVKDSADALRAIVNAYGAQLAALGTTGNYDVLPVTKGGTGGVTPAAARTGLGLKSAAVADIVGTASQSGGVPTGAVIERGSTVNGEYTKFADGTLECWFAPPYLTHVANSDLLTSWTLPFPIAAIGTAMCTVSLRSPNSTNNFVVNKLQAGLGLTSATFRSNFSVAQDYLLYFYLKGRWY